jgi:hypothetical protein
VAMGDDSILTSPDTTDTTTITETAISTSTTVLVRVTAGRRLAGTVTEAITPIPVMPDGEVKVPR